MAFTGKVVAVTGAASGIGRATALGFGRQGARVALCDRHAAGLADAASAMRAEGAETQEIELDVSDPAQVTPAIAKVLQTWGKLDVLVNAAGINHAGATSSGPLLQIREEDWDGILQVNLLGTIYCAQAAARHMRQRRSGRIVNIASVAGAVPRINSGAYSVSKAGVRMFTKCLALELARYGVTVNAIAPGPIDTPMLRGGVDGTGDPQRGERLLVGVPELFRLGVPLGKLGQPEDVASAILYLASEAAHHLTGVILNVDGMAQIS
jgi:2,3-dihydro-2,3-dihydroxybenzoate dehydrogenase